SSGLWSTSSTPPPDGFTSLSAFRQASRTPGYVEGENVAIEYRWVEGQYELVRRPVAGIVAGPIPAAVAVNAATAIPIVFYVAGDPVKLGVVAGLARPGGNATGVNNFAAELGAKQLGLLRELLPIAARIGLMIGPINAIRGVTKNVTAAAPATRPRP